MKERALSGSLPVFSSFPGTLINVNGTAPIRQMLRKVPIHRRVLVEAERNRMLVDQVIEPTKGPWACACGPGEKEGWKLVVVCGLL